MKRIPMLAVLALLMMTGCSKDTLIEAEQDYMQLEVSSKTDLTGKGKTFSGAGFDFIEFISNSISNQEFVEEGLSLDPQIYMLKLGNFNGSITGYGKIKPTMSPYTFTSFTVTDADTPPECGYTVMYVVTAEGTLALGTRDYCSITITGKIYPWYYSEFGFYGGLFSGTATTHSGAGKLKALDNKDFEVYNLGNGKTGPAVNLETGVISLVIRDIH